MQAQSLGRDLRPFGDQDGATETFVQWLHHVALRFASGTIAAVRKAEATPAARGSGIVKNSNNGGIAPGQNASDAAGTSAIAGRRVFVH